MRRSPGQGSDVPKPGDPGGSDDRFRGLLDALSEGVVIHRGGSVLEANQEIARILGYPLDEILSKDIRDVLGLEQLPEHHLSGEQRFFDIARMRPDGTRFVAEVSSREIVYPGGSAHLTTVRDVTEHKRIEKDLRRSEQELRSILANMQDTYYRTDREGRITLATPSSYDLIRFTPEELLGTKVADLYVYPEQRERFLELMEKNGGRVEQHRTFLKRKDGAHIWVSTNAHYYYDQDGQVAGIEGTTRDITHMIEAEQRLERSRRIAEQASKAKSAFLAMMSHEIRTPMNGVLTTAELLRRTRLDERQRRYLETITSSGRLLQTLLDDVLDLSKLEAGKLALQHDEFDLHRLLENLDALIAPLANSKGLAFFVNCRARRPLYLRGDATRLQQALLNLLSNAVKFTETGSVTLSVKTATGAGGHRVTLRVSDTGIGIPMAEQRRLFEPFEQGHNSVGKRFGGTGLGLAITKSLIELMEGTITLRSSEGVGTTIELSVPFAPGSAPEQLAETRERPCRKLSLLLVDDDPVNRSSMGALLESDGHDVTLANDGWEALEWLSRSRFDYLLIDLHMPEIDGIEVVETLAETHPEVLKRMHIVALTADTRPETIARCHSSGIPHVLAKPLNRAALNSIFLGSEPLSAEQCERTNEAHPLLDVAYLAEIHDELGIAHLASSLELFRQYSREGKERLRKGCEAGDTEAVRYWSHRLAGSSASIGLRELSHEARALSQSLTDGKTDVDIEDTCLRIEGLIAASTETLARWIEERTAPADPA